MFKKLFLTVLALTLFTACQATAAPARMAPAPGAQSAGTPGSLIWEVRDIESLDSELTWVEIGDAANPTEFTHTVGGQEVTAQVRWKHSDRIVGIAVSNQWRKPSFYRSTYYIGSWTLTDGVFAKAWLSDLENQYAMIGFEDEVKFFFVFDGTTLKVACLPANPH
jgi:hypothetical protein